MSLVGVLFIGVSQGLGLDARSRSLIETGRIDVSHVSVSFISVRSAGLGLVLRSTRQGKLPGFVVDHVSELINGRPSRACQ